MDGHGGSARTQLAGGVLSGTDAWSREARRVRDLATCRGLALPEEDLALQDVHDLQALQTRVQRARAGQSGRIWAARWPWRARAGRLA
jgi:hypothetical protein